MVLMPTSQLHETEWVTVVGLGRVELPTNGLGKQWTVLTRCENLALYYIAQADTTPGV